MKKIWLIVDFDGNFWIGRGWDKPKKVEKEIMVTDFSDYDWDYHGHHIYKEVGTGKFEKTWDVFCKDTWPEYFFTIDKNILRPDLQKRTYSDDAIQIGGQKL